MLTADETITLIASFANRTQRAWLQKAAACAAVLHYAIAFRIAFTTHDATSIEINHDAKLFTVTLGVASAAMPAA